MWDIEKFSDRKVIIDDVGTVLTYAELMTQCDNIAQIIEKRCLVFMLCKNAIGSVTGYVSFVNNNIVPVLLSSRLDRELLDNLMNNYCPSYLWVPDEMADSFKDTKSEYKAYGYTLLKTGYLKEYPLNDELCLMLTTSGSTGSPKFVRLSYTNVKSNAESIVYQLRFKDTERPITTLPMNYTFGLTVVNSVLLKGATLLLTDKGLMQKEFWTFFKEQGATFFGGVTYTFEMLDRLRFFQMDLPSLNYMMQGGGKLTPELHKKFAEYADKNNKYFIVTYGQCEATAGMAYLPTEKSVEKCGSMGIAIPGGKIYLIDDNGNEIKDPYVSGELVYEGANVALGYAEKGEDLILGDENKGILQTGDMAQFDDDGFYYIVGRKKRFLKIYGNRVSLDEVDRLLKAEFGNIDVASTGVDDHMYIFVTDEKYAEPVVKFLCEKTGLNPAAFKSIVIDEIPKSDAGKTLYKELLKYYQQEI